MRGSRRGKRTARGLLVRLRDGASDAFWTVRRASKDGIRASAERGGPLLAGLLRAVISIVQVVPAIVGGGLRAIGRFLRRIVDAVASAIWGTVDAIGRVVRPERAVALVALAAAILLAVSQFTDYAGVRAGSPDYADVSAVAPAPLVDTTQAGSAHAWVLLPAAAIAIVALFLARRGRWRVARLISMVGVAGIAIALLVDRPKGLDTGDAGTAFSGAKATLLGGFYVEVAASAVLVLCGLLLARYLKAAAPRSRRRRRRGRAPRVGSEPLGYAGGST
jgi:hypothetical protein